MKETFQPLNDFERSLAQAKAGEISPESLIRTFLQCEIVVPSGTPVSDDGLGITPLFYDKEGVQMMAVFAAPERAEPVSKKAPFTFVTTGLKVITRIVPGFGIVVNPGYAIGMDISPQGISEIIRDFTTKKSN